MDLTSPLTIHVDPEAAKAFLDAPEDERRKIEMLLGLQLERYIATRRETLPDVMDRMGARATANGMTEEILESILDDGR